MAEWRWSAEAGKWETTPTATPWQPQRVRGERKREREREVLERESDQKKRIV